MCFFPMIDCHYHSIKCLAETQPSGLTDKFGSSGISLQPVPGVIEPSENSEPIEGRPRLDMLDAPREWEDAPDKPAFGGSFARFIRPARPAIGERDSRHHPAPLMPASEITAVETLILPEMPATITPLVYAIPVQLLAYHTAVFMGTDVDQPRNLAKSVTVE